MPRLEPGDLLARRYLLLEPLASGGMSVIWRAFDQSLSRMVAVKVHSASLRNGLGERDRVRHEARVTARLVHQDAIEIYDYGEAVTARGEVAAYVVMRLLDGVPLAARIAEGRLPWAEAAAITARMAAVLAQAHACGLVHRDVTAENVMLTPDGPKLLDFGIAAYVGDADDGHGTPPYVAPERLIGAPAHPAADVYTLGVLLYAMLTGATPYQETTWEELQAARRMGPPPRPAGAPRRVAALCQRCLSPEPERRPSARQVAEILTARPARRPRPHRPGLAAVSALTLLSLSWLAYSEPISLPEPVRPYVTPQPTPDLMRAVSGFNAALDGARDDVALDLRQVLQGVVENPDPQQPKIAGLRQKLADRQREGGLSPGSRALLENYLTEIATVLRQP